MLHQSAALNGGTYDILIESGLLFRSGQVFRDILPKAGNILLVTDENVAPLYAQTVFDSLAVMGYRVKTVVLPSGERTKSAETVNALYSEMFAFGIESGDAVAALGGGALCDTVGFAAATWLGGTPLVCMPTTLTAQTDAAVGGRVGVNLPQGGPLIGTVRQPCCVITDPDCLMSLSARDFSSGMASAIRIAVAADAILYDLLWRCATRAGAMGRIEDIILACCKAKVRLLQSGEDDAVRQVPGYGQVFADAVLSAYRYEKIRCGEALAIGMSRADGVGTLLGITPPRVAQQVHEILERYRLPTETNLPQEAFSRALLRGRAAESTRVPLVVPEDIGRMRVKEINAAELLSLCGD